MGYEPQPAIPNRPCKSVGEVINDQGDGRSKRSTRLTLPSFPYYLGDMMAEEEKRELKLRGSLDISPSSETSRDAERSRRGSC